jgi:tRNA-uridine 2-sulfurtransferase
MNEKRRIRALGLCSGGLDSILSALVLRDQGIEVEWIAFETPFFSSHKAREASARVNIPLRVKNITPTYLAMLKNPPAGYGKNMNPCMDCHSLMFRLAGEEMKDGGFDFLFSGEVAGQRPMSQTKQSLRYVEKHSGFEGFILRPLSAKHLPETLPEIQGKVDRELLLDFRGRSRKPQIELARKYGVTRYPAPAGGCLLTDKGFSGRLKDLFHHQDDVEESDLELLKFGRHLRLTEDVKIIVGRTRQDNESILSCHRPEKDFILKLEKLPGPTVVIPGGAGKDLISLSAAICAGYSKAPLESAVEVCIQTPDGREKLRVIPIMPGEIKHLLI